MDKILFVRQFHVIYAGSEKGFERFGIVLEGVLLLNRNRITYCQPDGRSGLVEHLMTETDQPNPVVDQAQRIVEP